MKVGCSRSKTFLTHIHEKRRCKRRVVPSDEYSDLIPECHELKLPTRAFEDEFYLVLRRSGWTRKSKATVQYMREQRVLHNWR
jgi:hypothetical protein